MEKSIEKAFDEKAIGRKLIESASGDYYASIDDMSSNIIYETLTEKISRIQAVCDLVLTAVNGEDDIPANVSWLLGDAVSNCELAGNLAEALYDRQKGDEKTIEQS